MNDPDITEKVDELLAERATQFWVLVKAARDYVAKDGWDIFVAEDGHNSIRRANLEPLRKALEPFNE